MTHRFLAFGAFAAFALSGCGGDDKYVTPDPTTCAVYLWEPGDHEFETWPAMEYLREDSSTATGYRFDIDRERYPMLRRYGNHARIATEHLATLDGFGVNAAAWAEFSRPFVAAQLPVADGEAHVDDPAGLVVLDETGPVLWPIQIQTTADSLGESRLLSVIPLRPLPEKAEAVFFVTRQVQQATTDDCVSTSSGAHPLIHRAKGRDADALEALVELGVIEGADDLIVLQPFVTQSIYHESIAIAADIASRPDGDFVLDVDPETDCELFMPTPSYRYCTGRIDVVNYRDASGRIVFDDNDAPIRHSEYELHVYLWIPVEQPDGPLPTMLFGHGLNGSSMEHASAVLPYAAESGTGIVVVGVDAVEHGNHPDRRKDGNEALFDFFAVEFPDGGPIVDSLRLRDNFRQSAFDKLQVTRAILANQDLDGDGTIDVDLSKMSYAGVSLGAIMGAELLALTDVYQAAMLSMPGGRVAAIVTDDESVFSPLISVLLPFGVSINPLEIQKVFSVLQTAIDRGDAASHAARVLENRADPESTVPDVLVLVALDDDTVPNAENYAFARAMGLGIVPPVRRPALGLPALPFGEGVTISNNVAGGTATAGLIQFETIERQNGSITKATHGNLTESKQSVEAIFSFFESKWETGTAELIDPYLAVPLPL
jgi:hypothetical protein